MVLHMKGQNMPKAKSTFKWMPYPKEDAIRSGIKVSWHYYRNKADAEKCAKAAKHNAVRQMELGYDFGYCAPGSIYGPGQQNFHPDMWEVCIP